MNNTFELRKGKLVFEDDKIIITDNARSRKLSSLFSAGILLFVGIFSLVKYMKAGDVHSLRSGLLIGIAGLLLFIVALFKSVQSEINLKDVKSMKLRRIFFRDILYIKLNNNKIRQIDGIFNAERLREYIETNFDKK